MDNARAMASASSRSYSVTTEASNHSSTTSSDAASSAANRKRKRSAQGCVVAENDVIVEELKKIRGKIRESSHLAGNYGRAIASIQHHTEPVTSAREAKQLRNIGNYIANQIQAILQKHQINNSASGSSTSSSTTTEPPRQPLPRPAPPLRQATPSTAAPVAAVSSSATERRDYAPAEGKQPWYLLRALAQEKATADARAITVKALLTKMLASGYDGNAAKLRACMAPLVNTHQVIARALDGGVYLTDRGVRSAELCTNQPVTSASTSTSISLSSTSIVDNGGRGEPTRPVPKPSLSQAPPCVELIDSDDDYDSDAETLRALSASPPRGGGDDNESEPDVEPPLSQLQRRAPVVASDFIQDSDEWEVVLVLDHREILSRRNRDILERKLLECNVTCEVRSLNVGDVQWVARRYRGLESVEEFMLNVIVERKQVNDLSGSIIDRRYNEQKTRLRDSGMTHVIYLVEGSLTQQTTVRTSGMQTALVRTQVQNQFFVQLCQNADESVAFLKGVHMSLLAKLPVGTRCRNRERSEGFRPSPVFAPAVMTLDDWKRQFCQPIRSYSDFNEQFRKKADFSVGEIYQMMLMQVQGLSSGRTVGLSALHPTFQHLSKAIDRGEKLQDVRYGESQRRMGAKTHEFLQFLLQSTDYERDTPTVNGASGNTNEN